MSSKLTSNLHHGIKISTYPILFQRGIHGDVKPSNLLLDASGIIKLCNFEYAGKLIQARAESQQARCPLYMPPERLDDTSTLFYTASDVWSLGVTFVELLTGKYPFAGSENEAVKKICHGDLPRLKQANGFSLEICDVMEMCLQRDPTKRPHYTDLLEHTFLKFHQIQRTEVKEWLRNRLDTEQLHQVDAEVAKLREDRRKFMEQTDKAIAAKEQKREQLVATRKTTPLSTSSSVTPKNPMTPNSIRSEMRKLKIEDPKLTEQELGCMIGLKRLTFRRFMDTKPINKENLATVIEKATEKFRQ